MNLPTRVINLGLKITLLSFAVFSYNVHSETIKLGNYSGKPGYFVKIGNEFQLTLDAIIMNAEVAREIEKLNFKGLADEKTCEVKGMYQSIGYTLFKIKKCK